MTNVTPENRLDEVLALLIEGARALLAELKEKEQLGTLSKHEAELLASARSAVGKLANEA